MLTSDDGVAWHIEPLTIEGHGPPNAFAVVRYGDQWAIVASAPQTGGGASDTVLLMGRPGAWKLDVPAQLVGLGVTSVARSPSGALLVLTGSAKGSRLWRLSPLSS